jgi:hypothetical protein
MAVRQTEGKKTCLGLQGCRTVSRLHRNSRKIAAVSGQQSLSRVEVSGFFLVIFKKHVSTNLNEKRLATARWIGALYLQELPKKSVQCGQRSKK